MPRLPTLKRKPAEATTPGGLDFVLTTMLSSIPGKDQTDVLYHISHSHRKPR